MAKCQECKRQASKIIPARYPKTTSTTQKQFGNLRIYQNMVQNPKVFEMDKKTFSDQSVFTLQSVEITEIYSSAILIKIS